MALKRPRMDFILTNRILTAVPKAAMFFQGTLGAFNALPQIVGSPVPVASSPNGQPPRSDVWAYTTNAEGLVSAPLVHNTGASVVEEIGPGTYGAVPGK